MQYPPALRNSLLPLDRRLTCDASWTRRAILLSVTTTILLLTLYASGGATVAPWNGDFISSLRRNDTATQPFRDRPRLCYLRYDLHDSSR